ncbi:hypothetical protein GF324_14195 [bacterium]|nr:hypothetical protein [bacterium]
MPWTLEDMRAGRWEKRPCTSLHGRTLGVIGVGNTGKAVVRRAAGFGMHLLGNDLVEMPGSFLRETGIRMVDKETLLAESDYVSTNCTLNETSYRIIDRHALSLMNPGAVLINCARGPLVHEEELINALREDRIAGAALDVFEEEPLRPDSPLRRMDNVLLSPHNANSSPEHWQRIHQRTVEQLIEELERTGGENNR